MTENKKYTNKLSALFMRTIREFRPVYNELYYLSKDLNYWQKKKVYGWFWRALKNQCKKDIRESKKKDGTIL